MHRVGALQRSLHRVDQLLDGEFAQFFRNRIRVLGNGQLDLDRVVRFGDAELGFRIPGRGVVRVDRPREHDGESRLGGIVAIGYAAELAGEPVPRRSLGQEVGRHCHDHRGVRPWHVVGDFGRLAGGR